MYGGYKVNGIFKTIQGEGRHTGTTAVFCRFSKCNLWSGHEIDRKSSVCQFCDTNFRGGEHYEDAEALCDAIDKEWGDSKASRFVVLTGGEPLMQLDVSIAYELRSRGYYVAVETNGTIAAPAGVLSMIDWVCVSPKAGTKVRIQRQDEIKLVYPQYELMPDEIKATFPDCENFYLQPMDGDRVRYNSAATVGYCMDNPEWKVSAQLHKFLEIE